jgi:hypothetical protein
MYIYVTSITDGEVIGRYSLGTYELRRRLSQLLYGDESACKRHIDAERKRSPDKSEVDMYQDAIFRLERDRGRW